MATTGEIKWASLIARAKTQVPFNRRISEYWFEFSFGPYTSFRSPVSNVLGSRLVDYSWLVPSKRAPTVTLVLVFHRHKGLIREEARFRVVWPYVWRRPRSGAGVICWFPYREESVFVVASEYSSAGRIVVRKISLSNSYRRRVSTSAITLPRLINLSLKAGVLVPKGSYPRVPSVRRGRGSFRLNSSARPNPEIRTVLFTSASESTGIPYFESTENLEVYRRAWTGTTTPGFGSLKRRQLPVNGHTVEIQVTNRSMGYDLRKKNIAPFNYGNSWGATIYPFRFGPAGYSDSQFTGVQNRAIKNLNANAFLGVQANIAQALVQSKQTVNMIAKNATNIAAALLLLRKGRFSAAADRLLVNSRSTSIRKGNPSKSKSLANNWLELQYGWKPLLSDIDGSMRALASVLQGPPPSARSKASAHGEISNRLPYYGPGSATIPIGWETNQRSWSVRYGVRYRVSAPSLSFLSQLGFTNPINLAWEILPWSFVVDWFLPIGPYLESLSAPHGVEFQSGYVTRFSRCTTQINVSYNGKMPGDKTADFSTYSNQTRESIALQRTALLSWPTMAPPTFQSPFSTTHAVNAIALLKQAFGRR